MKNILAFETSGPVLSVALGTRDGLVRELHSKIRLKHSENLIPLVERLLRRERLSLEKVEAFAIDRGPGSFTGLRIGFSFLKGLLAARKKPCYGALSLDMIAEKIKLAEDSRLGVLVDARRETIYSRFYLCRKGEWVSEGKPEILSLSQLKGRLQEGTRLTGDALVNYRVPLEETFGNRIHFLHPESWFPSAASLVRWFQASDPRLSLLKSPTDFLPLYFRVSEAEEKRRIVMSHGH